MSLFSTGGTSYPDIVFILFLILPFVISSVLNPAVFYYNYRKEPTVPRFLYKVLAVFDFLTCLILPVIFIYKISIKEDPNCYFYEYYGMYHCNANFGPKLWERLTGVVIYSLLVTPNCILAVLATIRYVQIKNPFGRLKMRYSVLFIVLYLIYVVAVFSVMFLDKLAYYLSLSQTVENIFTLTRDVNQTQGMKSMITTTLLSWGPCFLCQLVSFVCSILAIIQLYYYSTKTERSGNKSQVDNCKATLRIFIANAGGLVYTVMHLVWYFGLSDWEPSRLQVICFYIYNNLLPLYLSCFNPIIFICFTNNFMKELRSNRSAAQRGVYSVGGTANNGGTAKCSRQGTVVTMLSNDPNLDRNVL